MMYAVAPVPSAFQLYVPDSGGVGWSMRSMPHVAPDWVPSVCTFAFCSIRATDGLCRSAVRWSADRDAEKPWSAVV